MRDPQRPTRIVLKVGSAVVAPRASLDPEAIGRLANTIASVREAGVQVAVVSSGAIACGMRALGLGSMPGAITSRQATASIGQSMLMRAWSQALGWHGLLPAQILLSASDLDDHRRCINARHTADAILAGGHIPIINENDTVASAEIRLGDNDRLAALTACLLGADLLVMLSTAGGLRDRAGAGDVLPIVTDITGARAHIAPGPSAVGTGGMATKLDAAEIAGRAGIPTILAGPRADVASLLTGAAPEPHTRFEPTRRPGAVPPRKAWLGFVGAPKGAITLDDGAASALQARGASLLAVGVRAADGDFTRGDLIDIRGPSGAIIARGLTAYAAEDIRRIAGVRTEQIEQVLGYRYTDEVVHRDDLLVLDPAPQADAETTP